MLLFTGAHFLEVLEGDEWALDELWLCLERDKRHCDLVRIGDESCADRWFPEWMMAYADHADVGVQIETLRSPPVPIFPRWSEIIRPIMLHADSM
jgi:Sensors of blue-light using FAD